jgi:hypothetical protein
MRCSLIVMALLTCVLVAQTKQSAHGTLRKDLVGKGWEQLPHSSYPGFRLPLEWSGGRFEYRLHESSERHSLACIVRQHESRYVILSAVEFSDLSDDEEPEQDCYFQERPNCAGRLCDGLLLGVGKSSAKSVINGAYLPREVWRFTHEKKTFERVSPRGVVCRPQSYAN